MTAVWPFSGRIVRPEAAGRAVTAMSEPPVEGDASTIVTRPDPAAYETIEASYFIYRQKRDGHTHTGVVCEIAVSAFVDGSVRGHEAVQPKRVEALVRQQATTAERPAPVALLHRSGPAYTDALNRATASEPVLDFDGPEGFRQIVWRVPQGEVSDVLTADLVDSTHYVADGHHRVAAALEAWKQQGCPESAGILCIVHPMNGLTLSAFHRRVAGPVEPDALHRVLSEHFTVRPSRARPDLQPGRFGLYVDGDWFVVEPLPRSPDRLDVTTLQVDVLDHLEPLPADAAVEIASARTTVDELVQRCDSDAGALFALAPPSLTKLTDLADAGGVMPPKTTYFSPKPCSGILLRPTSTWQRRTAG